MKTQQQEILKALILVIVSLVLTACSTSKEAMLPAGDRSMLDIWQSEDSGGTTRNAAAAARDSLRRPLTDAERQTNVDSDRSYSRTQESEISQQFPRLPNPDLVMYVFPHFAGGDSTGTGLQYSVSFLQPGAVCDAR